MAQWVECLNHSLSVMSCNSIKSSTCYFEQETVPSSLSTGWF